MPRPNLVVTVLFRKNASRSHRFIEWDKLDATIQLRFAKKLKERLTSPRIQSDKLSGMAAGYKIKLRSASYPLVYQVVDSRLVTTVLAVGKRERSEAYTAAQK